MCNLCFGSEVEALQRPIYMKRTLIGDIIHMERDPIKETYTLYQLQRPMYMERNLLREIMHMERDPIHMERDPIKETYELCP